MSVIIPNPGDGEAVVADGWYPSPATPIRIALEAQGVTVVTEQARLLGEHQSAWSRYLSSGGPMPRSERVREWCERAGVELEVGEAGWRLQRQGDGGPSADE